MVNYAGNHWFGALTAQNLTGLDLETGDDLRDVSPASVNASIGAYLFGHRSRVGLDISRRGDKLFEPDVRFSRIGFTSFDLFGMYQLNDALILRARAANLTNALYTKRYRNLSIDLDGRPQDLTYYQPGAQRQADARVRVLGVCAHENELRRRRCSRRTPMLKRIVTLLHRWVGLPLGVLFLTTLVTGLIVGGADLLRALDGKGQTYRETSIEEDARALERMVQDVPRIFQAVLPTPHTPYYQARARGETTRIYRIGDLEPIDHRESFGGLYRLALGLHRTFLLGRQGGALGVSGADAVAWVGLIATVLSLLGIWLWWSYRRAFRWSRLVPFRWTRNEMFRSHMTAGVVTVVAVVLLCVTGAAITYRGVTRAALDASLIGDAGFREFPYYVASDWETWLKLAEQEMDGDLTMVAFPRRRGGQAAPVDFEYGVVDPASAVQFRFVTESDWLGMAGSRVFLDPRQSALIGTARFDDLPVGQRLYSLIVPLHSGRSVARRTSPHCCSARRWRPS